MFHYTVVLIRLLRFACPLKKSCLVLFKEITGVCYENYTVRSKDKAIPLQAWTGLRVPGV